LIKGSFNKEYTILNGLRCTEPPGKEQEIFKKFWIMIVVLMIFGTLPPLIFLNMILDSSSAIYLFTVLQLAAIIAILSYTIYKNKEIRDTEKEDVSARYLMNTILSLYRLKDLDYKA